MTRTTPEAVASAPAPSAGVEVSRQVYAPVGTGVPESDVPSQEIRSALSVLPPVQVRTTSPVARWMSVTRQDAAG